MQAKMHEGEVDTDEALVERLLAEQFPQWAELPIARVPSAGTDNAIYRLGADLAVRLPRIDWATEQADFERAWLPRLAPHLPVAIPQPVAHGVPAAGYPWRWSVYRWLPGDDANSAQIDSLTQTALDLAEFVVSLQRIDPSGGPAGGRSAPLRGRDAGTRKAIEAVAGMFDVDALTEVWETALRAPEWDRPPVWAHCDLLRGNLLFEEGRLTAVIDFSGLSVGDPACDLMIAWALFSGESRECYREALAADDATWARGRGHALSQALHFIPYYLDTNPVGVANARHAVAEVLADARTWP